MFICRFWALHRLNTKGMRFNWRHHRVLLLQHARIEQMSILLCFHPRKLNQPLSGEETNYRLSAIDMHSDASV